MRQFILTATVVATDDRVRTFLSALNDQIESVLGDDEIMKDMVEVEIGSWVEQGGDDREFILDDLRFVFTNRGGDLAINESRPVTSKAVSDILMTEGYLVTLKCKTTFTIGDGTFFECSICEGHPGSHVSDDMVGAKLVWGGNGG